MFAPSICSTGRQIRSDDLMPDLNMDLHQYASELYSRVATDGMILRRKELSGAKSSWVPQPKLCHQNVTTLCETSPWFKPVRGWLCLGDKANGLVTFLAHSVVMFPDGEMYDITPSNASKDYPFISSGLTDDEYADLIEKNKCRQIVLNLACSSACIQ